MCSGVDAPSPLKWVLPLKCTSINSPMPPPSLYNLSQVWWTQNSSVEQAGELQRITEGNDTAYQVLDSCSRQGNIENTMMLVDSKCPRGMRTKADVVWGVTLGQTWHSNSVTKDPDWDSVWSLSPQRLVKISQIMQHRTRTIKGFENHVLT